MDKRLEQDRTPEKRMTTKNLREIYRLAEEKYGPDYGNMNLGKILEENPDWVKELDLPIQLPDQVITSEKSLRGLEIATAIDATVKNARRDFMNRTSGEKKDSVPPMPS
jgi:hypothetical protein